ncbi:MAG: leucine-rich repeat domain-containing protein, partial [Gemmatimonadota bacterium]|nr:leucine-rich repeat domain-containing protein [Gemmatimonadota bacterium]
RMWPAEVTRLSKLEYISIHGQPLNLTGPVTQLPIKQATVYLPVDDSFWNMAELEELEVFSSQIARATERTHQDEFLTWGWDSQIEVPEGIGQLQNLKKLRVGNGYKEIVTSLPETISQLTQLEELHIGPSAIQLPSSLSALTNLQSLHITGHGQLPVSWSQLASLKVLRIVSPQYVLLGHSSLYNDAGLTDYIDGDGYIHGPLPPEWSNLSNIEALSVAVNEAGYLNGELPAEWSSLTKLQGIYLGNHEFEGHLPAEWGQLTQLKYLDLSNNLLDGPIPPEWCQMTSLESLYLDGNALSGSIPSQISDLVNLKILSLSDNQLTGSLVDFSEMRSLESIGLADNLLSGKINSRRFPTSIEYINISGNNFDKSGAFPNLRHLTNLRSFSELSTWPGPISYTDVCPKLPPYLREQGVWACYHM